MTIASTQASHVPASMRAVLLTAYGGPEVLVVTDTHPVPKPTANQVLVRVVTAGCNAADRVTMRGDPKGARIGIGLTQPAAGTVLGLDFSGTIVAVGSNVHDYKPGDAVFGAHAGPGSFAEYVAVPTARIARVPRGWSFAQAATLPIAGLTAIQALRAGGVKAGASVLINGASGGVGMFAVQVAKKVLDAKRVVGVCAGANGGMVADLGADEVVDYTRESCTSTSKGLKYDSVIDMVGNHPFAEYKPVLTDHGRWVSVGGPGGGLLGQMGTALGNVIGSVFASQKAVFCLMSPSQQDLQYLAKLAEESKVKTIIQQRFGLVDAAEAMRVLEGQNIAGKLVVEVDPSKSDAIPYAVV